MGSACGANVWSIGWGCETPLGEQASPRLSFREFEIGAEKAIPSEGVIRKLADLLNDEFGELMALAGRIPSDVTDYMRADPKMPEFLRRARARKISAEELMALLDKEKDGG